MADEERKGNGQDVMPTTYPDNEIDGFRMGGLFDLRVRLAFEVLQHGDLKALLPEGGDEVERGKLAARACLAAVTEVVRLAEEAGLVKPLPEGGNISTTLRRHAPRIVRWQAEQQMAGMALQRELGSRIATPPGTPPGVGSILPGDGKPN